MVKTAIGIALLLVVSSRVDAQIAFDSSGSGEVSNGTSVSYTHTITGTSALLVVGVHTLTGSDVVNAPTYNGVALQLIDKVLIGGAPSWVYQYALANAPQGAHTLTVTTTSAVKLAVVSASYSGVLGLPVDNSTTAWVPVGTDVQATTTLTPNANNTWTILVGGVAGPPMGAGSGSTMRVTSGEFGIFPYADRVGIFDSNGPVPGGSAKSMTITGTEPYTEFGTVMASYAPAQTTSGPLPLLYQSNLEYLGGFLVPTTCGSDFLDSGGAATIAYRPGVTGPGTLYIKSNAQNVTEITIAEPVNNASLSALNRAQCVPGQEFREPTEDKKLDAANDGNPASPTGMLVLDGRLWINIGVYYDASASQNLSLMSRPLDLSVTGQAKGLYGLTYDAPFKSSMATKLIAPISADWQDAMGGDVFLSKFNTPVLTSESFGPNAIVTKTTELSAQDDGTRYPAAAVPLNYPDASRSLASLDFNESDDGMVLHRVYTTFSHSHTDGSLVQPAGTSTLLVFQVAGATRGPSNGGNGYGGYGCGCSVEPTENGQVCPSKPQDTCEGGGYIYDPEREAHAPHGFPYVYQVVAYDMNDLVDVIQHPATSFSWKVRPYTYWEFDFPIVPRYQDGQEHALSNATYDSAHQLIYIAQRKCCEEPGIQKPLIHVYHVKLTP